jgi:2-polyprenyl-6-methoxyphenol hydroxylase-like FAD-dependent oxidoreductase
VTLLGDAAHLMALNGEGANLAMLDGAELGKAIAGNSSDPEAALLAYEEDLFARTAPIAAEGLEGEFMLIGPNTPRSLVEFVTQAQPER